MAQPQTTESTRPDSEAFAGEPVGQPWIVAIFLIVPALALLAALPVALTGWITWPDVIIAAVLYAITAVGITVGYHRHFTHGSFKAGPVTRAALVVAGSLALEGRVSDWVADHRKHHAFSDLPGDPHSPWRFGTDTRAVAKGLWYAHMGWLLRSNPTDVARYAPDLRRDPITRWASDRFVWMVAATLLLPALLGGLVTWSWQGALSAFFWAGLVRIALVHQVTWSINSVCHVWGRRPFRTRDRSGNVAWLAVPSLGESWHNYHHADPTSARHGVLRRQIDLSAGIIRLLERFGAARDVRWPSRERVHRKLIDPQEPVSVSGRLPRS
jgi:stearoyl-CoA desaturase (delta-9 desaturase)